MPDRLPRSHRPAGARAPERAPAAAPTLGNQTRLRLSALDPRAVARSGFDGGHPLPHRPALSRVFGRYDVDGIRAHTGEAARVASRTLGASAYAMGEDIGFRGTPSLGTTAHEVTHVLAQRAGVGPTGAMGRAGDRHEALAEAVAERARRGASAEGLLDRAIGPRARRPGPIRAAAPVQREIGDAAEVGDVVTDGTTRFTIEKVETAPDGSKLYTIRNPDMIMPLEVTGDDRFYDRFVPSPESTKGSTLRKKPGIWDRMKSSWSVGTTKVSKATRTGAYKYGKMTIDSALEEDDFDLQESGRTFSMFSETMGVESGASSSAIKRMGTGIDALSSASQFGLDRAIDRTMDLRVSTEERIRRTLPKSGGRKAEEKVGQLFQVLGGLVQTVVPVIGGALASPLTGSGDALETHSGGLSKTKALAHGSLTVGKDTALGAIPFYGNYVGFVGMCSDVKRLFSASAGPTKLETLRQLIEQRDALLRIGDELQELGYDPYRRLEGYAAALKVLDRYIGKYEAKVRALGKAGKAGLLKYSGGFASDES